MWYAAAGRKEFEGELIAWLARLIPIAVWNPEGMAKLGNLNPYHEGEPKSAELVELEKWQAKRRWALMFGNVKRRLGGD